MNLTLKRRKRLGIKPVLRNKVSLNSLCRNLIRLKFACLIIKTKKLILSLPDKLARINREVINIANIDEIKRNIKNGNDLDDLFMAAAGMAICVKYRIILTRRCDRHLPEISCVDSRQRAYSES